MRGKNLGLTAVVFDRYPLYLDVLTRLLEAREIEVLGGTTLPAEALELLEEHSPRFFVAGLDPESGGMNGIALIREAIAQSPGLKVIALSSGNGDISIDEVFAAGASAYVTNDASAEDISVAIRQMFEHSIHLAAHRRKPDRSAQITEDAGLTAREKEILALVAEGHSNAELARMLWVTPQTVKFHLSNIYRKLNVSNRTQASRWAQIANLAPDSHKPTLVETG